ncbi:MAG: hypothetical protein IT292_02685 [Deltaproteobacteria bacterium]|nr:hypothetical protein [Deltaproteobacteria bacterium]
MPSNTHYQLHSYSYGLNTLSKTAYPGIIHDFLPSSAAALRIIAEEGHSYAKANTPTSQNPKITSNRHPGLSPLNWLQGKSKCNVFVGEALYRAGLEMPTFKMLDGSHHYVNAEALSAMKKHFTPITNIHLLQSGDLMVIDKTNRRGENGAHVELITNIDSAHNFLKTAGAHDKGAYETDNSYILKNLPEDISSNNKLSNSAYVYFLRPIKALPNPVLP